MKFFVLLIPSKNIKKAVADANSIEKALINRTFIVLSNTFHKEVRKSLISLIVHAFFCTIITCVHYNEIVPEIARCSGSLIKRTIVNSVGTAIANCWNVNP
jgi:hypothetical protein